MQRILTLFLFTGVIFATFGSDMVGAQQFGASGNPLPRFISLAASKAYMRTGPGRQYPIRWVYNRRLLPLEVIDEHRAWRKVRDHDGETGWMHVSLLSPRRTAIITDGPHQLFDDKSPASPHTLTAEAGVIGEIAACEGIWCELEIDGTSGWIERRYIWGVYDREELD